MKLIRNRMPTIVRYAFVAAAGTILAAPATAQTFEEIVVVAQKREQTLQQVPIAVSVVSGDVIRDSQILRARAWKLSPLRVRAKAWRACLKYSGFLDRVASPWKRTPSL